MNSFLEQEKHFEFIKLTMNGKYFSRWINLAKVIKMMMARFNYKSA